MIEDSRYYWSHLKTKTVTVRVDQKQQNLGVVFRVCSMIDLGNGRQTIILEHVECPDSYNRRNSDNDAAVPFSMGNLDFIYTSCAQPRNQDISSLLANLYKDASVEKIVEDVLAPDDIIVFKQEDSSMKIKMVETLRVVKENTYKKSKAKYAL